MKTAFIAGLYQHFVYTQVTYRHELREEERARTSTQNGDDFSSHLLLCSCQEGARSVGKYYWKEPTAVKRGLGLASRLLWSTSIL